MKKFFVIFAAILLTVGLGSIAYFASDYILQSARQAGTVILLRDVIAAKFGAPIGGGLIGLGIFARLSDKYGW